MDIFRTLSITIGLLLIGSGSLLSAPLDDLVAEALQNNAELNLSMARWHQAQHRPAQLSSLDDPMVSFAFSNYPTDTYSADDTPMTGNEVRLSQKLPFPGKLAARGAMAQAEADWFEALYQDQRYQTEQKVKDAWYRLYYLERAQQLLQKNVTILDDVIRLAETRYATGQALQQDVLKAQVQRSRFLDRLWVLEQQQVTAEADLQQLLNRVDTVDASIPARLSLTSLAYEPEELYRLAEQNRPRFQAYRSLLQKFQAQERVARLNDNPDITLWAGYRFRDDNLPDGGTDFVSAGVSMNLPIYREKRRAAVAEALSAQQTVRRQQEAFAASIKRNVQDAYARMEQAREQVMLYHDGLLPQAMQSYQAAISAYQVGKVEFLTLLDALLTLNRLEIEAERAAAEHQRSVARLEAECAMTLIDAEADPNAQDKVVTVHKDDL